MRALQLAHGVVVTDNIQDKSLDNSGGRVGSVVGRNTCTSTHPSVHVYVDVHVQVSRAAMTHIVRRPIVRRLYSLIPHEHIRSYIYMYMHM